MRAIWSGEIAFGLVTIPAKLFTATKDLTPQFHQLHKECGSRISMARRCAKCARDIAWDEIGKGYEVSKGEYALFSKAELAKLEDDTTGTIDIAEFINLKEVDLAYIEKSYWVGPGGKNSRGFTLLRTVLEETGRVALARVKLRTRTRLGLLRPRGQLFSLDVMRFAEELVQPDDVAMPDSKPATDREKKLALHLVDELSGPFDPAKHPDEYRNAVLAAVDEKIEAGAIARDTTAEEERAGAAETGGAQVIDLADLLTRSLQAANHPGPAKAKPAEAEEEGAEARPAKKKQAARDGKRRAVS
jgi:DNA end-binding protein Ku